MSSAPLFRAELTSAFKSLRGHVRALAELAALHRLRRIEPTPAAAAAPPTPNPTTSDTVGARGAEKKNEQLARDLAAARLELRVAHDQDAAQTERIRTLSAQLDAHAAALERAEREKSDLLQKLATTADVLGAVRAAFLACTERMTEIDAERDRFARVAAALRAQNTRLAEHVRVLETHARWLADQIEHVVVSRANH